MVSNLFFFLLFFLRSSKKNHVHDYFSVFFWKRLWISQKDFSGRMFCCPFYFFGFFYGFCFSHTQCKNGRHGISYPFYFFSSWTLNHMGDNISFLRCIVLYLLVRVRIQHSICPCLLRWFLCFCNCNIFWCLSLQSTFFIIVKQTGQFFYVLI